MKGDWDLPLDPLVALREGDPAPFEDFVRRTTRPLVAFFRRQGAGTHLAEDLVQEVYLKLHNHAPRYRAERRFQAFCLQVARNVWIDWSRKRGVRAAEKGADEPAVLEAGQPLGPAAFPAPEESASLEEEAGRLRRLLAELPETHRSAFELGVIQELPYAEIAELLDIPVGTVKSRVFHAVRKLRGALEEAGEEGLN